MYRSNTRYHSYPPDYEHYYLQQVGHGLPVFHGSSAQRGHGLGNILGALFRSAVPLLKRGAKTLGKEALRTGVEIVGDVVEGRSIRDAAKSRSIAAGKRVAKRAVSRVTQSKNDKKRKRTTKPAIRKRAKRAKRSLDIFD